MAFQQGQTDHIWPSRNAMRRLCQVFPVSSLNLETATFWRLPVINQKTGVGTGARLERISPGVNMLLQESQLSRRHWTWPIGALAESHPLTGADDFRAAKGSIGDSRTAARFSALSAPTILAAFPNASPCLLDFQVCPGLGRPKGACINLVSFLSQSPSSGRLFVHDSPNRLVSPTTGSNA